MQNKENQPEKKSGGGNLVGKIELELGAFSYWAFLALVMGWRFRGGLFGNFLILAGIIYWIAWIWKNLGKITIEWVFSELIPLLILIIFLLILERYESF